MTNYDELVRLGLSRDFVADMFLDAFARKEKRLRLGLRGRAIRHCAEQRLLPSSPGATAHGPPSPLSTSARAAGDDESSAGQCAPARPPAAGA